MRYGFECMLDLIHYDHYLTMKATPMISLLVPMQIKEQKDYISMLIIVRNEVADLLPRH